LVFREGHTIENGGVAEVNRAASDTTDATNPAKYTSTTKYKTDTKVALKTLQKPIVLLVAAPRALLL